MGSIIAGLGSAIIPAIPMPVVVPGIVHILLPWCRTLKELPIQALWCGSFHRAGHFTSGTVVVCLGYICVAVYTEVNLIAALHSLTRRTMVISPDSYCIMYCLTI